MKSFLFFIFIAFVTTFTAHGALKEDLGEGLAYLRVTDWAADAAVVEKTIAEEPALVLDLRNTTGDAEAGKQLSSALIYPTAPQRVRLVLINATTSPALVAAASGALRDVVTLGPQSPAVVPDIVVAISSEDDRRAYDALTEGTPLKKLINGTLDKQRYDEARLVQDHANGGASPADADSGAEDDSPAAASDSPEEPSQPADEKATPPAPTDTVLRRAIHLHRALLALKKL